MNIQSLLNTCFKTLLHGLSSHPSHGGSSNESTVFALNLFHNPGDSSNKSTVFALYMFHSMDCMYSFEPHPGGTSNEFPVFVKYLFPHYVQNIDLESPNGDSSNA